MVTQSSVMGGEVSTPYGNDDEGQAPGESMRGVDSRMPSVGFSLGMEDSIDSEHKATVIRIYSLAAPHMRTFHLAWFGFFVSFCSTFMAAPLAPVIREDLNLTKTQLGNANSASLAGTVFMRLAMGTLCDTVGPRKAYGLLMLLVAFPCFAMTCVTTYTEFVACRLLIGCSLASFVGSQYWASSMFTPKIVGGANAIVGGWGNLGGGVTQVVTVIMFGYFSAYGPAFRAWRQCFFCPGLLHLISGMLILFTGIDTPDGNKDDIARKAGKKVLSKGEGWRNMVAGFTNYRTWIFTITYGFCFGVELVVDNVLADYFSNEFNQNLIQAGRIASYSGLMNVCSRALGGMMSDLMASRFGMRGRLWTLWFFQTASGGVCVAFGFQRASLNKSITTMVIFSFLTQFSCGCTYGIIPFISKRALGVVSGCVGAGGNAIAAILQYIFFTNTQVVVSEAMWHLGVTIMAFTGLVPLCHFPMWGSMFFPPRTVAAGVLATDEITYYTKEYTADEKAEGKDHCATLFGQEAAQSERSVHFVTPSPSMENLKSHDVVDAKSPSFSIA